METGLSDSLPASSGEHANVSNLRERSCILTVNGGSSSLKFALFDTKSIAADSPESPAGRPD